MLEFQSTVDPWMALRFGTYVHLLYEQLVKERKLTTKGLLPPIFPLLYNGDKTWKAATELKTLISLPDTTALWRYQPNMRYYLVDESRYPEGKPGSLSGLIFRLENAVTPQDFRAALDDMVQAMPSHLDSVKRAVAVWITYVVAPHKGITLSPHDIENLDEVKDMLATRIEQWEVNIRQEGVQEGEGALLLKLLSLKYGDVPDWVKDNVAQADEKTIEHWAARLFLAKTLSEVFE